MNRSKIKIVLGVLLLLISPTPLYAQEVKSITVEFLEQSTTDQQHEDVKEFHYLGGQEVVIPFLLHSSISKSPTLKAEAAQVGYSMRTPYEMNAKITESDSSTSSFKKDLSLVLPEVKRETKFEVVISIEGAESSEVGRINIVLYPTDILEPLSEWSKNYQIRLKDSKWLLAELFEKNDIEFIDFKASFPKTEKRPVVLIIVGEPGERFLEDRLRAANESIIILREEYEIFPKVTVQAIEGGTLVDVELKIVDTLSNNPMHQKTFLEIVKLTNTFNQ
jgi:hypothetical protein